MKRVCCLILIAALGLLCAACAYPPPEQYANFLADLDLEMRFEMCLEQVENGKTDFYTAGELATLEEDIAACAIDDGDVEQANDLLTDTARRLADAVRYGRDGQEEKAAKALKAAKISFEDAKNRISAIKAETANE